MNGESKESGLSIVEDAVMRTVYREGLSENYIRILRKPQRTIITHLPLRLDDGRLKMVKAYWVLHSNILGPGKGGLRIDDKTSLEDLQLLAQLMTWKCALVGVPLGGFKGSIVYDGKKMSEDEKERAVRAYTRSLIKVLGPKSAIPSPDLNTSARLMAVLMDTYSMSVGATIPGVCTGKPLEVGGIPGRNRAVGWGLVFLMEDYLRRLHETMRGKTVVVQGIGHVGKNIARSAAEKGAKVIAISDSRAAIYNPDGLDINDVIAFKERNGSLKDYPRADMIDQKEMLKLKCDTFVPCATQHTITGDIMEEINADLIIEGANMPLTPEADSIANERGITVLPDILANSGGLVVSYFEWVQDIQALHWDMQKVNHELQKIMVRTFTDVYSTHVQEGLNYRDASYTLAVKRVISALKYRGVYP